MTKSELLAINDAPLIEDNHEDDDFPLDPVYDYELDEDYTELEF